MERSFNLLSPKGRAKLIWSTCLTIFLLQFNIFKKDPIYSSFFMFLILWKCTIGHNHIFTSIAGSNISQPIQCGGFELHHLDYNSTANILHFLWHFITHPNSLWISILTHKYLKDRHLSQVLARSQDSPTYFHLSSLCFMDNE